MAIWNRILSRKSVSSSSSSGENTGIPATPIISAAPTTATATTANSSISDAPTTPNSSPRSTKSASRVAKTLSWRPKPSKEQRRASTYVHPTERPLTEANLLHQEILSAFTFKFGRRKSSAGGWTNCSNISPGNSRPGSLDASGHAQYMQHNHHHHHPHHSPGHMEMDRRVSSMAGSPPREQDGE